MSFENSPFAIVMFEGSKYEVVATNWLRCHGEKVFCFWPPEHFANIKIVKMCSKRVPIGADWSQHLVIIKKLKGKFFILYYF